MKVQNTKQLRNAYRSYVDSNDVYLWEVYGSYSRAKEEAYDYCRTLMADHDGYGLKIIAHSVMTFSVGFIGYIDGLKHFFYITRDYDRTMPLEYVDKDGVVYEKLFAI